MLHPTSRACMQQVSVKVSCDVSYTRIRRSTSDQYHKQQRRCSHYQLQRHIIQVFKIMQLTMDMCWDDIILSTYELKSSSAAQ